MWACGVTTRTRTAVAVDVRCKEGLGGTGADGEGAARVLGKAARAVVDQQPIGLAIIALEDVEVCGTRG